MAHRYAQVIIPVPSAATEPDPLGVAVPPPHAFSWRGQDYMVRSVLARWHLEARWWEAAPSAARRGASPTASDRSYYRLVCVPDLLCEVYYDARAGQWVLDVVYD